MKYVIYGAGIIAQKYIERNGIEQIEAIIDSNVDKVGKNFHGKIIQDKSNLQKNIFDENVKLLVTVHDWYPVCMKMAEIINPENILYMNEEQEVYGMNGTNVQYAYSALESNLKLDIFNKNFLPRPTIQRKVRFFMLPIVHAYSAIKMLVEEYSIDTAYDVCIIFPKGISESIYFEDFEQLKKELEREKIKYVAYNQYDIKKDMPDICFFFLEEYLKTISEYKKYCKMTVAVQHRPILIHSTRHEIIELIFGNEYSKGVSYFVCNKFMTEWLSSRFDYKEKILNFGFPKLDLLYNEINYNRNIPLEWKRKIKNRKVFLYNWMTILGKRLEEELSFNTYDRYLNYLINYFMNRPDLCLIIRTRETLQKQVPNYIWDDSKREQFKTICENCDNIILDETETYYASFACADGLLSSFSSLITYFLCIGKPVCFLHGCEEKYKNECREWMSLCENARDEKDINIFIDKVVNGFQYNSIFTEEYDGNVCKRIKGKLDDEIRIFSND